MGYSKRTMWMVFLLMGVIIALLHTAGAEDELEIFAGQDKVVRVQVPMEFNDAEIIKPSPLDPKKTYNFSWDFDDRKDSNLDGVFDNDAESNERFTEWTYWIPRTYTVTLTVDDGEFEVKDTLQVTVRPNEPPVIHANETETARVAEVHVFSADAIDDFTQPYILRWHWEFDDGTSSDDSPPVLHTYYTEGTYNVTIRVTDPDNGWTEHMITLTVIEDLVTSTINIGEGDTIKGTFGFIGTITSDVLLDHVQIQLDDEAWLLAEGVTDWSYILDTTTLSLGYHLIEVRGLAGINEYEMISLVFIVDNPPLVDIAHSTGVTRYNGTVLASGTALDDGWLEKVEACVDDEPWTPVTGTSEWSFPIDTGDLSHGNHTLYVRAYDGEQYSDIASIQLFVDKIPWVLFDDPSAWEVTSTSITVTGSDHDDLGRPTVYVRVNGGPWKLTERGAPSLPDPSGWWYEINTSNLPKGNHELEARAFDGYQFSHIVSIFFPTDRPPDVTIDPLPEDREVKNRLLLSGTFSDDGTAEWIEYRIDGGNWVNISLSTNWSVAVPVKDLEPGIHEVEVRVYDGSNYSEIASTTFKKEKEEEPGFGAIIVAVSILAATFIVANDRRRENR